MMSSRIKSATRGGFRPLEKCVGHVQKIWTPFGKLFAPPGVPSWLRELLREIKTFLFIAFSIDFYTMRIFI